MAADKVAILGAGSVGCFIGGCWKAAQLPVTFIGRPRMAADIAANGLTISDYNGWRDHLSDIDYRTEPSALAEASTILVCVKSGATAQAAADIAEHGRPPALVISFQNGISNVDLLRTHLAGRFEVARGMVPYNVVYLGSGQFHKAVGGDLYVDDRPETRALARRIGGGPAALRDEPGC